MLVLLLWQPQAPSLSPLRVALYTVLAPPYPLVGIFYPLVGISIHCASHSQPVFHSLRMVCLLACGGSPCTSITCYCRYEILQGCIQSPAPAIIPRNNTSPAKIVLGCTPCASHVWAHNQDNCILGVYRYRRCWAAVCLLSRAEGQGATPPGSAQGTPLQTPLTPATPLTTPFFYGELQCCVEVIVEVACMSCKRFRL